MSVLNKINASSVLTLRTMQDANNLRVAALEQQILQAKQQRDSDAANLNLRRSKCISRPRKISHHSTAI